MANELSIAHYNGPLSQIAKAAAKLDANGRQKPYEIQLVNSAGKLIAQMRVLHTPELGTLELRVVGVNGPQFSDFRLSQLLERAEQGIKDACEESDVPASHWAKLGEKVRAELNQLKKEILAL